MVSQEVDRQECGEFLEQFRNFVETNMLGRKGGYEAPTMNSSEAEDSHQLYLPLQAASAESTFRQFQHKAD